jgi:hypothetical protein
MEEFFTRIYENMIDRVSGPMHLRLILQPLMAAILATLAGLKDAKKGWPPYFWGLETHPEERAEMIRDGWRRIGKVFILAAILDIVYQFIVQRWVYPLEVLITAVLLAIVPFFIVRGPVNRLATLLKKPAPSIRS